jgi:hypothetical protein
MAFIEWVRRSPVTAVRRSFRSTHRHRVERFAQRLTTPLFRRGFDRFQVIVNQILATLANLEINLIQSQFGHTKYDLGHE